MSRDKSVLLFVCPFCQATRGDHTICCGCWPMAVDISDVSLGAAAAGLAIEVISKLISAPAEKPAPEREERDRRLRDRIPARFARLPGVREAG